MFEKSKLKKYYAIVLVEAETYPDAVLRFQEALNFEFINNKIKEGAGKLEMVDMREEVQEKKK